MNATREPRTSGGSPLLLKPAPANRRVPAAVPSLVQRSRPDPEESKTKKKARPFAVAANRGSCEPGNATSERVPAEVPSVDQTIPPAEKASRLPSGIMCPPSRAAPIRRVPAIVPSLEKRAPEAPPPSAKKKIRPEKAVSSRGRAAPMRTRPVPAGVPLLVQSSLPRSRSRTRNDRFEPGGVRTSDSRSKKVGLVSRRVPAAVPSVVHSAQVAPDEPAQPVKKARGPAASRGGLTKRL